MLLPVSEHKPLNLLIYDARATGKKEIDVQYLQSLSEFLSLYKPLHIFSTNYDICVERFCVISSRKYFDGFAHEWTGHFSGKSDDIRGCIIQFLINNRLSLSFSNESAFCKRWASKESTL
jgi:hypothetical protein